MAIKATIKINSEELQTFTSLKIEQAISGHHRFELKIPLSQDVDIIGDSSDFISKPISIEFSDSSKGNKHLNFFKGIITEISFDLRNGRHGYKTLIGYSPTILFEHGPGFVSYNNKTLKDIFRATMENFPMNLITSNINPNFRDPIPYSSQYNESKFNYLKRLANKYGEWFYYDGTDLRLGPPEPSATVDLNYPSSTSLHLSLQIVPLNFTKSGYDYKNDNLEFTDASDTDDPDLGSYGNIVYDKSGGLFNATSKYTSNSNSQKKAHLDTEVKVEKHQRASSLVMLSGSSNNENAGLGIGKTITVNANNSDQVVAYGKYIVTEVTHLIEAGGNYFNSFKAIPQTVSHPPLAQVDTPVTLLETATVLDNKDPEKLGRLIVQFRWQHGKEQTDWIRTNSLYNGANRGLNFNPEVDDEVMVSFANNDPDQPIVIGSLRNFSGAYDDAKDQHLTRFITSLYSMIKFNDSSDNDHGLHLNVNESSSNDGKPSIVNFIKSLFSGGKGTIEVNAQDEITISAPKITLKGDEIILDATEKIDLKSQGDISEKATASLSSKGATVSVNADASLAMSGATVDISGSGIVSMSAPMLKHN